MVVLLCLVLRGRCGRGKPGAEFLREQPQLIGAQLFAPSSALGGEQLTQQPLCLLQLRGQIDQHLLQNLGIFWQAVAVDRHYVKYTGSAAIHQA